MRRLAKLILLLLCPVAAQAAVCPTGYAYAKAFVIPAVSAGATLTSFPVALPFNGGATNFTGLSIPTSFTLPDLKVAGSGGKVQSSSGFDIVFCDAYSGGNLLNFERVNYVSTTGQVEFWVGRTLSGTASTTIWMFYDKASDTDHSASAAMWSAANYSIVQHLANGTTLSVADSTGTYTPTNHGAAVDPGVIDGGAVFVSASSQNIDSGAALAPSSVTVESWIKPTSGALTACGFAATNITAANNTGYMVGTGCGHNGSVILQLCPNSGCSSNSYLYSNAGIAVAGQWTHVAASATGNTMAMYLNGITQTSFVATQVSGVLTTSTSDFVTGGTSTLNWDGSLDEVRVASVLQSAAWEAANYQTQTAPNSFALMQDATLPGGMTSGAYCIPLTIDHTKVASTLTNFPLLVHGIYPWMADVTHGGFAVNGNSGHDIQFFSNSGCTTSVPFERVYWTNTSGDSGWRVKIASLSNTVDTTVYVRIGNPADTGDASTLWMATANYAGAYLGGDPTVVDTLDSGVSAINLACGTSIASTYTPVGGGWYLGGLQTDNATCVSSLTTAGDTLSAHGYPTGSAVGHVHIWARATPATFAVTGTNCNTADCNFGGYGKANGTGQRGFTWEPRTSQLLGMESTTLNVAGPAVLIQNTGTTPTFVMDDGWHMYDYDFPTAGGDLTTSALFIDGSPVTAPIYLTSTNVLDTNNTACCTNQPEVRIGRYAAHGQGWFSFGQVGQFDVANVSQPAAFVSTRYNNEASPGAFYTFGTATPFVGSSRQPIVSVITKLEKPR